jgi:hypothetical protein
MANLITPAQAYRAHDMAKGKATGKWHLMNPRCNFSTWAQSVCNQIIQLKRTDFKVRPHHKRDVADLAAQDICQRCLGPCGITD